MGRGHRVTDVTSTTIAKSFEPETDKAVVTHYPISVELSALRVPLIVGKARGFRDVSINTNQ